MILSGELRRQLCPIYTPTKIFGDGRHYATLDIERSETILWFVFAAKDNSTATTDSRALQATNGGGVSSSAATAGAALTAVLLAGYLLLLVPELSPSSF